MQVIDKRGIPLTTTFNDLGIGDAFQDEDGDIAIKTDFGMAIYWCEKSKNWVPAYSFAESDLVLPLEVTYTFEREGGRK